MGYISSVLLGIGASVKAHGSSRLGGDSGFRSRSVKQAVPVIPTLYYDALIYEIWKRNHSEFTGISSFCVFTLSFPNSSFVIFSVTYSHKIWLEGFLKLNSHPQIYPLLIAFIFHFIIFSLLKFAD